MHFEIGNNISEEEGTMSVFTSASLKECLKEWKDKKYSEPNYFIDVWEHDEPIAEIKIIKHSYVCHSCFTKLDEDEVIWSTANGVLNTDTGNPYCDMCLPDEPEEEK